jgi:hypothetical protein
MMLDSSNNPKLSPVRSAALLAVLLLVTQAWLVTGALAAGDPCGLDCPCGPEQDCGGDGPCVPGCSDCGCCPSIAPLVVAEGNSGHLALTPLALAPTDGYWPVRELSGRVFRPPRT